MSAQYPLNCGCRSATYYGLCDSHQAEHDADQARRMGVSDLRFSHRDFTDLTQLAKTLHTIKLQLISNPTKYCVIKIIPEMKDEPDVSNSD
jgi:hypothetical protein